jgi:hypothetical protein
MSHAQTTPVSTQNTSLTHTLDAGKRMLLYIMSGSLAADR